MRCVASPKGLRSLSVHVSLALTEEVEAIMGGLEEAGAHRGGRDAWAAGSRELTLRFKLKLKRKLELKLIFPSY